MSAAKLSVKIVAAENDNHIGKTFKGRPAWALSLLCNSGEAGVSRFEHASTSLPFYIFKLREELGEDAITTEHESHGGEFSGTHARYRIADKALAIEQYEPSEKTKPTTAATVRASKNPKSNDKSEGGSHG